MSYAPHMMFSAGPAWLSLDVATLVVVVANVLGAVMVLPQATRSLVHREVAGVSGSWAAVSAAFNAWWVVYAIGVDSWAIIPATAIGVAAYGAVMWALLRHGAESTRRTIATFVVAGGLGIVVPLPALLLGGWVTVGVVLGLLYGAQLSPAVVSAWRNRDLSGVSSATWLFAWLEAALWGYHGVRVGDRGLVILAITGTVMSTAVLVRLVMVRRPALGGRRRLRPGLV